MAVERETFTIHFSSFQYFLSHNHRAFSSITFWCSYSRSNCMWCIVWLLLLTILLNGRHIIWSNSGIMKGYNDGKNTTTANIMPPSKAIMATWKLWLYKRKLWIFSNCIFAFSLSFSISYRERSFLFIFFCSFSRNLIFIGDGWIIFHIETLDLQSLIPYKILQHHFYTQFATESTESFF